MTSRRRQQILLRRLSSATTVDDASVVLFFSQVRSIIGAPRSTISTRLTRLTAYPPIPILEPCTRVDITVNASVFRIRIGVRSSPRVMCII